MLELELMWIAFFNLKIPIPCSLPYTQRTSKPTRASMAENQTVGSLLVNYFMGNFVSDLMFTSKWEDGWTYVNLQGVTCLFNMLQLTGIRPPLPEELPHGVPVELPMEQLLDFLYTRTCSPSFYKRTRGPIRKSFTPVAKVILTSLNDPDWNGRCRYLRSIREKRLIPDSTVSELFILMEWGVPTDQQIESSKARAVGFWALEHVRTPYGSHDSCGPVRRTKKSEVRRAGGLPYGTGDGSRTEELPAGGEPVRREDGEPGETKE